MADFSVLSLNVFGLPFFLGWRRLARLARQLNRYPVTVVCLQELQQNAYASLLARSLKAYPYKVVQRNIVAPKGGLGVFSRLPLGRQHFEVYEDHGLRWIISLADWALYKGILVTHLPYQEQEIVLLNTHLNANYTGDWRRQNPLARVQQRQVQQLTRLIQQLPAQALIVVCGDFNFPRTSFLYEELISDSGLTDPLAGDERATYRPLPLVPSRWKIPLDYVLVRDPGWKNFQLQADVLAVEDSTPGRSRQRFLTDHYALTLKAQWEAS
jgi:endonuclease/exonuclease/phosphatase family metal-dependent hydrolase